MQLTQNTCIETGDSSIKFGVTELLLTFSLCQLALEERSGVHNTDDSVDTAGDQDGLEWCVISVLTQTIKDYKLV